MRNTSGTDPDRAALNSHRDVSEVPGQALDNPTPDQPADADDRLITAYLNGDGGAFETLYHRHKGPIYRFFLRQLPHAQAHDAFQETWTKFIANIDKYQARGSFQAYIFTLAHNALMDHHRRGMRDRTDAALLDDIEDESIDLDDDLDQAQMANKLYGEIGKLPINQRTVWIMRQESQLSLAQIAKLTQTSIEGVKSRLRYANQKLTAGMRRYVQS